MDHPLTALEKYASESKAASAKIVELAWVIERHPTLNREDKDAMLQLLIDSTDHEEKAVTHLRVALGGI